jgi:hypothetical protein
VVVSEYIQFKGDASTVDIHIHIHIHIHIRSKEQEALPTYKLTSTRQTISHQLQIIIVVIIIKATSYS